MKALSSRKASFVVGDTEEAAAFVKKAMSAFGTFNHKEYDIEVEVRLVSSTRVRTGKDQQTEVLKCLIGESGTSAWYNGPDKYLFDFLQQKFMWGNRNLHLTAGEQFALYKKLVRDEAIDRMVISRLRAKFGSGFLEGHI